MGSFAGINTTSASVSVGAITLNYTDGTLTVEHGETTLDFNIAAGAFSVRIRNAGFAGGGTDDVATVNGVDLFPGNELVFDHVVDETNNELLLLPAFAVVTNGATIWYQVTKR